MFLMGNNACKSIENIPDWLKWLFKKKTDWFQLFDYYVSDLTQEFQMLVTHGRCGQGHIAIWKKNLYLFQNSNIFSPWAEACRLPWFSAFLWACMQTKLLKKIKKQGVKIECCTGMYMDDAQKEGGLDKNNLFLQNKRAKQRCSTYREIFALSPHVELKHQVKDMERFFLTAGLVEGTDGRNLSSSSRRKEGLRRWESSVPPWETLGSRAWTA